MLNILFGGIKYKLMFMGAMLVLLLLFNPSLEKHKSYVKDHMSKQSTALGITSAVFSTEVDAALNTGLEYINTYVYSYTKSKLTGEVVSWGILGYVSVGDLGMHHFIKK